MKGDSRARARASSILFARRTRGYKVRRDSIVGLIMRNAWDVCVRMRSFVRRTNG